MQKVKKNAKAEQAQPSESHKEEWKASTTELVDENKKLKDENEKLKEENQDFPIALTEGEYLTMQLRKEREIEPLKQQRTKRPAEADVEERPLYKRPKAEN